MGKIAIASNRRLDRAVSNAIRNTADDILEVIISELSTTSNVPSSPGEPPHKQSGKLANSFTSSIDSDGVTISSDSPYAGMLEYGTSRMAARPYIAPNMGKFKEIARRNLAEEMK
jgi:phage gpG-like protein